MHGSPLQTYSEFIPSQCLRVGHQDGNTTEAATSSPVITDAGKYRCTWDQEGQDTNRAEMEGATKSAGTQPY